MPKLAKEGLRHAVRTINSAPSPYGRKAKEKRHLDIDAPVGDFSPVKPKTPENTKAK